MNNFEKRLFVNYSLKLINDINFNSYSFGEVLDFFIKEFKVNRKNFNFDEYGEVLLDTLRQREEFKKSFKRILNEQKEKIKPQNTLFEKKLLIIKDIYHLEQDEYQAFIFCLVKEVNNIFKEFYECINGDSFGTFAKCCLNVRYGRKDRILDNLYIKNLTDTKRGYIEINSDVLKAFDDLKTNNMKSIINILLGEPEKSNLKASDYSHLSNKQKTAVKILKSAVKKKQKGVNILLYGDVGTGKTEFAKLIANIAHIPMYAVKTEKANFKEAEREDRLIDLYSKQHILKCANNSCILFDEGEDVMNRGFSAFGSASKGYFNKILENTPVPVIWTTNNIYNVDPAFLRRMTYAIEFEKLTEEKRLNIWKKVLKKNKLKVKKSKIEELNKNYNIPPSLIANAVQSTKMIDGTEDDFEDFIENVAKVVSKKKNVKESKKEDFCAKSYDINLVNTDIDMDNLTKKIKQANKLNFSLCLYGEPGTGKSLYARYLANQLGIEVILKRASDLMSMYVGQTEQNIAKAFEEAKEKKAMLIFDEADSFLQNRNNASRSWEIAQVNEMLTQMESAEYPFVCTTNLLDSLDEASLRRFSFKIKFDFMTENQVNKALEHFFKIKNPKTNIKGLTAGDFATVKKKADFLNIDDSNEIEKMLFDEVKIKKSKSLQNTIGF